MVGALPHPADLPGPVPVFPPAGCPPVLLVAVPVFAPPEAFPPVFEPPTPDEPPLDPEPAPPDLPPVGFPLTVDVVPPSPSAPPSEALEPPAAFDDVADFPPLAAEVRSVLPPDVCALVRAVLPPEWAALFVEPPFAADVVFPDVTCVPPVVVDPESVGVVSLQPEATEQNTATSAIADLMIDAVAPDGRFRHGIDHNAST